GLGRAGAGEPEFGAGPLAGGTQQVAAERGVGQGALLHGPAGGEGAVGDAGQGGGVGVPGGGGGRRAGLLEGDDRLGVRLRVLLGAVLLATVAVAVAVAVAVVAVVAVVAAVVTGAGVGHVLGDGQQLRAAGLPLTAPLGRAGRHRGEGCVVRPRRLGGRRARADQLGPHHRARLAAGQALVALLPVAAGRRGQARQRHEGARRGEQGHRRTVHR